MATQYSLTNAFTAITEESGTIQNIGYESVELVSTTNAVAGEGIILLPGEKKAFKGSIKARSLGTTNTVNVVDFKEGVGGGDDVMAGASASADGKSGLVPTPTAGNENRFLRGDGSWAVPTDEDTQYQPATTLTDGLMSAADKTFVEDEKEYYRQPSTAYTAGQITYHASLPTGWYLECTTAGTTGSGDLSISSPSIGSTVTDGNVVWKINKPFSVTGGALADNIICRNVNTSSLVIFGGNGYRTGGQLFLWGGDSPQRAGEFALEVVDTDNNNVIRSLSAYKNGELYWNSQDLAGSAIVAKSLGANGYIKYASGLIVQWGRVSANNPTGTTNDGKKYVNASLPISFSGNFFVTANYYYSEDMFNTIAYPLGNSTIKIVYDKQYDYSIGWFAIGHY